jgi:hypothetical protein
MTVISGRVPIGRKQKILIGDLIPLPKSRSGWIPEKVKTGQLLNNPGIVSMDLERWVSNLASQHRREEDKPEKSLP